MEKRVFIAVLLSIAVMYGYSLLMPAPPRPPAGGQAVQKNVSTQTAPLTAPAAAIQSTALSAPATPAVDREIRVESDLFDAVFSSRGGSLKRLVLKKYRDAAGPQGKPVVLYSETNPAHLTFQSSAASAGFPAGLVFSSPGGSLSVTGSDEKTLEFTAVSQGVVFTKRYRIRGDSYSIGLEHQIANGSAAPVPVQFQIDLLNRSKQPEGEGSYDAFGPVTFSVGKLHSDSVKDIAKEAKKYEKEVAWTGFGIKYFLGAIIGKGGSLPEVRVKSLGDYIESSILSAPVVVQPGKAADFATQLYVGPKDFEILKAQGSRLEEVIDLGWFSAIAKPLLFALKFFYRYVGNYGIAIIIITVILKILFYPLTHKSYKSMKEMQKVQPMMTKLREKYKDDRDALNRAVMELYKEHKVNPLGGCLPMVVQIPVFFALYKALMFSIELRHAPFFLWIQDLAAKDPYYVTPIIMGVTMVVQQKMTPSTGMDPIQAKMMLALPVVFTFMFLNFPSGLVLYWLVNNVLTIAQQYYINKSLK